MAGTAEQTQLLDELANLLKKQNQQAQQGSISEVEQLGKQADSIVKKISRLFTSFPQTVTKSG